MFGIMGDWSTAARDLGVSYSTVVVVACVSHIQRIGCLSEKTVLHGGQSRSWSAEQGKENKIKTGSAPRPPNNGRGLQVYAYVRVGEERGKGI